jgi:CRISPR type III-A-associated RAMP protein Csm5
MEKMKIHPLKSYEVNLHILSPVHIGTGQELDPFSYIIQDKTLFMIDLAEWIEKFPDKNQMNQIMASDNFAIVRSFIAENFNLKEAVRCAVPIDSNNLLTTYDRSIRKKDPLNQVLISPMIRNELNMAAYLPGSSIKGSIRTAIANRFVKASGVTSKDARGRFDYNKKIFGQIKEDPMRWFKVADVHMGDASTAIIEAEEYPLNSEKQPTPKGYTEVALSLCHTGSPVVYPLRIAMADFQLHGEKIDLNFIIESLNQFYVSKYQEEYEKFYVLKRAERIRQGISPMNKSVAVLNTNEALVRIGHFSHIECVTLDEVRKPKTRVGKDRSPLPWGRTRTLANGIYPFGWAKLEFLDLEANPRPAKDWPFPLNGEKGPSFGVNSEKMEFVEKPIEVQSSIRKDATAGLDAVSKKEQKLRPTAMITLSPVEKLLKELDLIKSNDMGRIGTIIQKIDTLENDAEKAQVAVAVKNKMSAKKFKKYQKRKYLTELIQKLPKKKI